MEKGGSLVFFGEGKQMPSVEDVQRGTRNESRQNPGIERWDDDIILARQNQSRLAEPVQPGNARPAHARQQLPDISPAKGRFDQWGIGVSQVGMLPKRVAIEERRDDGHVGRIKIATWTEQFAQDTRLSGHGDRTRRRGYQDQATAARRVLIGELLCQRATPGDAQHIDDRMSQHVKHPGDQASKASKAEGEAWERRPSNPWYIKADRSDLVSPNVVERLDERVKQLQVGSKAIDQQQGRPAAIPLFYGHVQSYALDVDHCRSYGGVVTHVLLPDPVCSATQIRWSR